MSDVHGTKVAKREFWLYGSYSIREFLLYGSYSVRETQQSVEGGKALSTLSKIIAQHWVTFLTFRY